MLQVYTTFKDAGAKMIGHWPAKDYLHEDSKVPNVCTAFLTGPKLCGLHMLLSNATFAAVTLQSMCWNGMAGTARPHSYN